jgi:hypothetical protein
MVTRYGYSCAVDWVLTTWQRTTKGVDIEWARSSAVEHLTFNQRVVGSDPAGLTNLFNNSCNFELRFRAYRSCGVTLRVTIENLSGAEGLS